MLLIEKQNQNTPDKTVLECCPLSISSSTFYVLLTNQEQQTIISIFADNCLSGVFGLVNVCLLGFFVMEGGAVKRAICDEITNHQNKGLISVDRKTSLLSHVQYPVLYQSRLQRI